MNILLAPDKFKGTFTAEEICAIISRGLSEALPNASIDTCPIADGGDGFAEILRQSLNGEWVDCAAHDAIGRSVTARYALCGDVAVMEMSEASGIRLIPEQLRDVWNSSTFGTGEMMRHASEKSQVKRIIMGIGGSATNDAGCGMAAALGVKFYDEKGEVLEPTPRNLTNCRSIDISDCIDLPEILVACDVENTLLGEDGATRVYGPQKGVGEHDMIPMEDCFNQLIDMTGGQKEAETPGAGAAGGLGFGLLTYCGADLLSGFDLVASETNLLGKIRSADVVITGEGMLDAQTLHGKGPAGVAAMARSEAKKIIAIAGVIEPVARQLFDQAYALHDETRTLDETIRRAEELLVTCVKKLASEL
ncbi:MAG: glycerate kinase [Akkermansiaceae bacterium]|nr:glycerate kinase [Akkermansiaceae bacterium]